MRVALLGTGTLGGATAERILACGHRLTVYNRTREKAEPLGGLGAAVARTPGEAMGSAECVLLVLTHAEAIREVLFQQGEETDLKGLPILQMGTISPDESLSLLKRVEEAGGEYLEIPVLGSTPEVKKGDLTMMVGSREDQFERLLPLLTCLSSHPIRVGEVGKAAALKLALNQLIGSLTVAFSFSLGIVLRRGVDVDLFMRILRDSPLYARQFDKKLDKMLSRDFSQPHFTARNTLKDLQVMLEEGRAVGLETVAVEGIREVFGKAVAQGWGEDDYSSVYNAIHPGK